MKKLKEKARKIFILALSMLVGFTSLSGSLTAVKSADMSTAHVTFINAAAHGYRVHGPTGPNGNFTEKYHSGFELITMDGYGTVFCLEPWAAVDTGYQYQKDDINNVINNPTLHKRISLIGYYGYWQTSQNYSDYVTTQLMIWESRGWTVDKAPAYYASNKAAIESKITDHAKIPSFNQYEGSVNVGQTVTLTDSNGVLEKFMVGSGYPTANKMYELDGVQFSWSGNDLSLTPTVNAKEEFMLPLQNTKDADVGTPIAFVNHQALSPVDKVRDPSYSRIKLDVQKFGQLNISKQDEDGNYIPNTSFSLSYNTNMSDPIGTYTTGSNGKVLVEDLLARKVYIQEVSVPNDLVLDATIRSVDITANNTATYSATNKFKIGNLKITKQDEEGTFIPNTSFEVSYNADMSSPIGIYTTGSNGSVTISKLRAKKVYVQETAVPAPLILDPTIRAVTILHDDTVTHQATNVFKKGKIEIQKLDVDTNQAVKKAGAEFAIYKADNTYVNTIATNAEGIASLDGVRYGDYYFVETKAPTDYTINSTPVSFSITENGVTIKKSFSNKRTLGTVELTKVDGATGTAQGDASLEGAIYKLYAKENIVSPDNGSVKYAKDAEVATLTIKDGKAKVENLYLGKYYIKEITASSGYLVDPSSHDVTLNYTNQNTKVEVRAVTSTETVKKQAFSIIKISSNGDSGETPVLKGAQFTVKLTSDVNAKGWNNAKTYDVITTDEKGYALSKELPFGTYTVKETITPPEHETINDFTVKVTEDSREPQVWRIFNDVPFESLIAVIKVDAETGNVVRIAGAKFKIKNLDTGNYVGHWAWNPLPHYVDVFETTADGTVMTASEVRSGHYQLEEIEAPDGYLISREPVKFEITDKDAHQTAPDGSTVITNVRFSDVPVKGQVKIDKQAELFKGYDFRSTEFGNLYEPIYERGMLADVKFEIKAKTDIVGADGTLWYEAGASVTTMTTDGSNITTSALLPIGIDGKNLYTLQEIETAEGYVLDETIYTFKFKQIDDKIAVVYQTLLDDEGNEINTEDVISLNNDKQSSLTIANKQLEQSDVKDTSKSYEEVIFGVFADQVDELDQDSLVGVSKVDQDGNLGVNLSQHGDYYLQEVYTNNEYVLDVAKYPFNYSYNGDKIQIISLNDGDPIYNYLQRGSIAILKTDKETGKPLINVHFELATDEAFENVIKMTATDEQGKALFEEIEKGTYYIREVYNGSHDMVVEGYVKDPTIHKVIVDEQDQVISLTLNNQPVKGKVQFIKTGEAFNKVNIVEGKYGTEYHPVWTQETLLGSFLTIEAAENITTWDGTQWYRDGDEVITLESDWDTVDSLPLPVGKYRAYESQTPHGYITDSTVYEFEIMKNGLAEIQLNAITIDNARADVDINFTKSLEAQETFIDTDAYKDVVFGLYAREGVYDYMGKVAIEPGSLIGTSGIDADGHLLSTYDLPNGTYYFKELSTNNQYVLNEQEYDFEIGYQGAEIKAYTVDINEGNAIENILSRGTIEVIKTTQDKAYYNNIEQSFVDTLQKKDPNQLRNLLPKDNITYLTGVPFELATDKDFTSIIKTGTTDLDGRLVFDNLENGTYYVREKNALAYYVMDPTVHEIIIDKNGQFETIDVDNNLIESYVNIKKVDAYDHDKTLPYAGFTMYEDPECTKVLREIKTDTSGIAHFEGIKFGTTVYFKETSAPVGYLLSDEVIEVTINEAWINGEKDTRIIIFPDQPMPAEIIKEVETGDSTNSLSGTIAMVVSGCTLLGIYLKRRKEKAVK